MLRKLTQVIFCIIKIIFFKFHQSTLGGWEWSFIICFDLFFMRSYESHDQGYGFEKLTQVKLGCFFFL